MFKILTQGLSLGLATGATCLATCSPIYLPYLLSEKNSIGKSLVKVFEISAGRFLSYLAFGALSGFAGAKISGVNRNLFTSIAYILLTIFLLLNTFRVFKKSKHCSIPKVTRFTKSAFLLGILTGINFCPSFLIALSSSIELGGVTNGVLLFLGFFFGTTVYLIPIAFAAGLTYISKFKKIAQIFSIIIAVWFFSKGVMGIYEYFNHSHSKPISENTRTVDVFAPKQDILIVSTEKNIDYFIKLKNRLQKAVNGKLIFKTEKNLSEEDLQEGIVVFYDLMYENEKMNLIEERDNIGVEQGYSPDTIVNFLNSHAFRTETVFDWKFETKKE